MSASEVSGSRLTVAIGTTASKPGDLAGNLGQIQRLAMQAGAVGCDVLLTPEMSATGYGGYSEVLALAEPAGDGPVYKGLADIATQSGVIVLAGFVERAGTLRHIAHYAVEPSGRFTVQRKMRATPAERPLDPAVTLFYDDTEEIGHVVPGEERFVPLWIREVPCAIVICADWGVRGRTEILQRLGSRMIFLPTGAGGKREERVDDEELSSVEGRDKYARLVDERPYTGRGALDCRDNGWGFAAVNLCGFDGKQRYHGGSGSIVTPQGDVAAVIPACPNFTRAGPRLALATLHF
jgi:predicted amidohydrolase